MLDRVSALERCRSCTEVITQAGGAVGRTGPGTAGSASTLSIPKSEGTLWNGDDASDDLPFLRDTPHGPRTNTPQNDLTMVDATQSAEHAV